MDIPSDLPDYMQDFISAYTRMEIGGIGVPCPYWMNKIKDGKVVFRGFLNGKGPIENTKKALLKLVEKDVKLQKESLSAETIRKLAKRERIGIDCSGLAFRLLNLLVEHHYNNSQIDSLNDFFKEGIMKTNAHTLTSLKFCIPITDIRDVRLGDLIRMMGGKHVAVIISFNKGKLTYIHSAKITEIEGVHLGEINITDADKLLDQQNWLENTKYSENFGIKRFRKEAGDGIFRLKILNNG